jgi:hypothetical protein
MFPHVQLMECDQRFSIHKNQVFRLNLSYGRHKQVSGQVSRVCNFARCAVQHVRNEVTCGVTSGVDLYELLFVASVFRK